MKYHIRYIRFLIPALAATMFFSCGGPEQKTTPEAKEKPRVETPDFVADSAYHYIEEQLEFGPRIPNTDSHIQCAEYLANTLKRFTPHVTVQEFQTRAYDKTVLNGRNIIASFNPQSGARILLCAHWDSRPIADHDPDPENRSKPVPGANDGGSGTGVLLEIARQLKQKDPGVGVDIILFDAEDYGQPSSMQTQQSEDTWGLGSQHWSKNPHKNNYFAKYGILLDMVGDEDAQFLMEGFSLMYAPGIVKKVWNVAHQTGYGDYFPYREGTYITDDHYYVNTIRKIPTINIVHLDPTSANETFFDEWHTVKDDMSNISRSSLKATGQTVLEVVFREGH